MLSFSALLLVLVLSCVDSFNGLIANSAVKSRFHSSLTMGVTLYGSQNTRSPLVNWFLIENKIPFTQKPPRPNPNMFTQIPFLTDDNSVEVFESGAILLYLSDAYGGSQYDSAKKRAQYTKWVIWANAELDGLCFGKGMSGTQLDKPNRGLDILESYLKDKDWLVDNQFSVADVAVGSYLNYVPVFFSNVKPTSRPNILKYMTRCASRPAFAEAFGEGHQNMVQEKVKTWLAASSGGGGGFKIF